jgi:hypothetical protein
MLGESWQVPHVPVKDAGIPVTSLIPATPEIVIAFELKITLPLAILARAVDRELIQASYKLKIMGLNGAPVGLSPKLAGKESLMPMKNSCEANATGPPVARPSFRKPARRFLPSRRAGLLDRFKRNETRNLKVLHLSVFAVAVTRETPPPGKDPQPQMGHGIPFRERLSRTACASRRCRSNRY